MEDRTSSKEERERYKDCCCCLLLSFYLFVFLRPSLCAAAALVLDFVSTPCISLIQDLLSGGLGKDILEGGDGSGTTTLWTIGEGGREREGEGERKFVCLFD